MMDRTEIRRVVIIRPSALGDVCRTVPVLVSLKNALPQAEIDWVVQDAFAAAIEAHPHLGRPILFPRGRLAGWWRNPSHFLQALKWLNHLREGKYDLAIDFQGLSRSGIMTAATFARHKVGLQSAREFAWLTYNRRVRTNAIHTVDQMLALVEAIGIEPVRDMRLYVPTAARAWWLKQRVQLQFDQPDAPYAVIAPTSRWPSKNWPIDRFAQILAPVLDRGFQRVVLIGSPADVPKVEELLRDAAVKHLQDAGAVINLAGVTDIAQTMAIIAEAGLVIANDSAPLHMAVGFNRPIVGLFGPTDPAAVGPYQRETSVIRGYAAPDGESINFKDSKLGDRLMRLISTTAVLRKVDQVLNEHGAATRERAAVRAEPAP
jgi:ADP-heptose:LPS heptosyltransferase